MNYNKIIHSNFYIKFLKNIDNNKILFYRYNNNEKTYNDLKNYGAKLFNFLDQFKIRKKVIFTYSNKSFEMYSSIMPIFLQNCIWVPLSIHYPTERLKLIFEQLKPDLFLYDNNNESFLSFLKKNKVKCVNFKSIYRVKLSKKYLDNIFKKKILKTNINSTCMVYFTSGSTNVPKGIKISQKNLLIDVIDQKYHLFKNKIKNPVFGDYYDTAFSIFFDIFFPAVLLGAAISPGKTKFENSIPLEHIKENKVNVFIGVPSTIQLIKNYHKNKKTDLIFDVFILTGEPFLMKLIPYIYKIFKIKKLFNCYGSTETSNWTFFHKCSPNDLIKFPDEPYTPIGKPFRNAKLKIKNKELVIKGPTVSQGYIEQVQNKGVFVLNNKNKDNVYYTSDLVKKSFSKYFCIGRKSNLVKIRGYRVDISEIEYVLKKNKQIDNVIIYEKNKSNYENYLVAIILSKKKILDTVLVSYLTTKLPQYMIPKKFYFVKKLKLNSNGKVDRKKNILIFDKKLLRLHS
jgi:D-alanine--poly(phosphoribitol) ligase subunit 1